MGGRTPEIRVQEGYAAGISIPQLAFDNVMSVQRVYEVLGITDMTYYPQHVLRLAELVEKQGIVL